MAHWTEELFVNHPELFQINFELRTEYVHLEVDYLLEKLKEKGFETGRILDLNCGIGRHAVELGKRGIEVVGTDISTHYIDVATKRAEQAGVSEKAAFKVADMRNIAASLSSEKPFDGIICMWTSFGFYDDETNDDILKQCFGLIKPGGFFLLDIINRDWLIANFADSGYHTVGEMIVLAERNFDILTSRNFMKWTYLKPQGEENYRPEKLVTLDHRVWSLHELVGLFEKTGFKHETVYAGFGPGFNPQQPKLERIEQLMQSHMLVYICRKP